MLPRSTHTSSIKSSSGATVHDLLFPLYTIQLDSTSSRTGVTHQASPACVYSASLPLDTCTFSLDHLAFLGTGTVHIQLQFRHGAARNTQYWGVLGLYRLILILVAYSLLHGRDGVCTTTTSSFGRLSFFPVAVSAAHHRCLHSPRAGIGLLEHAVGVNHLLSPSSDHHRVSFLLVPADFFV